MIGVSVGEKKLSKLDYFKTLLSDKPTPLMGEAEIGSKKVVGMIKI